MTEDAKKAKAIIDEEFAFEISLKKVNPALVENEMVNIAMVGDQMKNHQGISGKMFSNLGANNVNIRAIAQGASERNISIIIAKKDTKKALNSLHEAFFEANVKELNLFVVGVGNVGSKLMEQIHQQKEYLQNILQLRIRVLRWQTAHHDVMIMVLNLPIGEDLAEETNNIDSFLIMQKHSTYVMVFLSITPQMKTLPEYQRYLEHNIGVVTVIKSSRPVEQLPKTKANFAKIQQSFLV